jgi:peptidoglycan/xylan/chitin deacetylase (PgdA/CDA1 family)
VKLKPTLKCILSFVAYYSGIEFLLVKLLPLNAAAIIMYHGVCEHSKLPPEVDFHLTPEDFERQLRFLTRRYRAVRLSELLAKLRTGARLNKEVVLTFDDGYRNNLTCAAPILARHHSPFSVFITTDYIGSDEWLPLNQLYGLWSAGKIPANEVVQLRNQLRTRSRQEASELICRLGAGVRAAQLPDDDSFAMLSWEQVKELARQGGEIGSHTQTHCCMTAEPANRRRDELEGSKEAIEARLGNAVTLFAYPYGKTPYIDPAFGLLVRECGYQCAITTEQGLVTPRSDPFRLPRMGYHKSIYMFAGEMLRFHLRTMWNQAFVTTIPGSSI